MFDQLKQAWERLRSVKGFSTWLWIVILFIVLALGMLISEPLPAFDSERGGGTFGSTGLAISVFLRWMAVIGLVYIAFLFFRKWQIKKTGPSRQRISVLERFYISPKQTLIVVKTDSREFLLGATDSSIQLITELDSIESEITPGQDFETLLSNQQVDVVKMNHENQ
ncbi:MAG: FliO/MopB family protein [Leptolinea sp.]|nr:FliO/MopB family protein [Leptolinea sp.]